MQTQNLTSQQAELQMLAVEYLNYENRRYRWSVDREELILKIDSCEGEIRKRLSYIKRAKNPALHAKHHAVIAEQKQEIERLERKIQHSIEDSKKLHFRWIERLESYEELLDSVIFKPYWAAKLQSLSHLPDAYKALQLIHGKDDFLKTHCYFIPEDLLDSLYHKYDAQRTKLVNQLLGF